FRRARIPCVAPKRSPARLIVALSAAAALAVFLLYTSIAGGTRPALKPSQLTARSGKVELSGVVLGPVTGDPYSHGGLHFRLRGRRRRLGGAHAKATPSRLRPERARRGLRRRARCGRRPPCRARPARLLADLRRRPHEPQAADALHDLRVLGWAGGIAPALAP